MPFFDAIIIRGVIRVHIVRVTVDLFSFPPSQQLDNFNFHHYHVRVHVHRHYGPPPPSPFSNTSVHCVRRMRLHVQKIDAYLFSTLILIVLEAESSSSAD